FSERLTAPAPMTPPAPGRFSTTRVCPSLGPMRSATSRAVLAGVLPGRKGTTSLIGLSGYCDAARTGASQLDRAALPTAMSQVRRFMMCLLSLGFFECGQHVLAAEGEVRGQAGSFSPARG